MALTATVYHVDLTAAALFENPGLSRFSGHVSDSGEGRWTITAAIEESAPAPVLSAALYQRFISRGEDDFAERLLSAMRFQLSRCRSQSFHPPIAISSCFFSSFNSRSSWRAKSPRR